MNGELIVRGDDLLPVKHELQGAIGYKLMEKAGLIRVWDDDQTFLIKLDELITFRMSKGENDGA